MYLTCRGHASIALARLHGDLDSGTVIEQLTTSIERILDGKTTEIEAMLITQAKVLEYVCYDALGKLSNSEMPHAEIYASIALRAQNQSRKTLVALANLKNPGRATFIKQQNNAINQQINNNSLNSKAKKYKKVANELISEVEHEKMDARRTITAITNNTASSALESFDRAKD